MADVFQVLKRDHDEVKAMLAELQEGPKAATGGATTEQQYFWPVLRQLGPDGNRMADLAIEQESEAERVLSDLSKLDVVDRRFDEVLAAFTAGARAHILFEEANAWPLLEASINADEAEALGDMITQAKTVAPTRPHPHTPPARGAASVGAAFQGLTDRL